LWERSLFRIASVAGTSSSRPVDIGNADVMGIVYCFTIFGLRPFYFSWSGRFPLTSKKRRADPYTIPGPTNKKTGRKEYT
jgi:hypothetical protein